MSYSNDLSVADIAAVTGGGNRGGWGGDWSSWIILFLIFGMFGMDGFGGFGGMFGGGRNNGGVNSEVQRGFDHSAVVQKLDGITNGLCDGFYATQNAINSGFNTTQMAIMQGNNALQAQLADCCCTTQRGIDSVRYDMATQACETRHAISDSTKSILENQNSNTRAILDFLTQDKIATLTAENQNLKFAASQSAQNGFIDAVVNSAVARLQTPVPVPSYIVPNPNCCYGNYNYGCNCA